jgi:hypothetical protein
MYRLLAPSRTSLAALGKGRRFEGLRRADVSLVLEVSGSNSLVALGKRRRLGVYHVAMQEPMKNVRKIAGDQQ